MNSITECLERINHLTQQNLEILKTINDSFFTKKEHLVVNVEDNKYVIPSFISLENKVNALQEGLNNLVNAPASGEAYFNYDGNSKTIQVRGFNNTPNSVTLDVDNTNKFYVDENYIFKDFITPNAHLKFDLTTIPDDISTVIVKKVVPITEEAKTVISSHIPEGEVSVQVAYKDIYKQLSVLKKGDDYEEYDTIRQLPIRQSIGTGTYVITKIIKDEILNDLTEQLTLEFSAKTPLVYKKFDETIDVDLEPGQYLTTYNDRVKLQIVEVNYRSHQLVLNVVNGDYLDLIPYTEEVNDLDVIPEMSKLRFFSVKDYSEDKYIDITLEEDQYIGIFVAPLNSRMNVQAPWGNGVIINSYEIRFNEDTDVTYKSYYDANIKNIGDILKEITSITNNSITKYNREEFDSFTNYQPIIDVENLDVVQINKHLNNSPTVQKIRSLYSQKKQYEIDLNEIQTKINDINTTLASVSFDDTSNLRTIYENQLDDMTKKKNETISAINSVINEISLAVNNTEIPIENAKYHIRGYFNWDVDDDSALSKYKEHVKGIKVEYRYKNKDQVTGSADSFQNGEFIYSDWNLMKGFNRQLHPNYQDRYTFEYDADNSDKNEPSFNQIDIPISQGETVDIRLKIVWDFGYPYIETLSDWSEIVNVPFPEEYLKDIQILTIIEENNNDIETNRFNNILIDNGIFKHVEDKQVDQDSVYFHHPEHIASGFYTDERRVIPLKDKLSTMNADIIKLQDLVYGSNSDNLKVEFVFNSTATLVQPDQDNVVNVAVDLPTIPSTAGGSTVKWKIINSINSYANIGVLKLTNVSKNSLRLYSIFPGNRNKPISDETRNIRILVNNKINVGTEADPQPIGSPSTMNYNSMLQCRNQFIYVRSTDAWTGDILNTTPQIPDNLIGTAVITNNLTQMFIDSDSTRSFKALDAGESIQIPIWFNFLSLKSPESLRFLDKIDISVDLRMSLYNDPVNYSFTLNHVTEDNASLNNKIIEAQTNTTKYSNVIPKIY